MYETLKTLHLGFALLTISGFVLRGCWMLVDSPRLTDRVTRIAPHIIDTLFLVTGIGMLAAVSMNPLTQPWLTGKLLGLLAYIVLGTLALKRGRTRRQRGLAFAAAVGVFIWIAGVGATKSLTSWASLLMS